MEYGKKVSRPPSPFTSSFLHNYLFHLDSTIWNTDVDIRYGMTLPVAEKPRRYVQAGNNGAEMRSTLWVTTSIIIRGAPARPELVVLWSGKPQLSIAPVRSEWLYGLWKEGG